MFTIQKATINDIQLINEMAQIVFPATYREILSKEQLDYMMIHGTSRPLPPRGSDPSDGTSGGTDSCRHGCRGIRQSHRGFPRWRSTDRKSVV